jgi:hypothetical protein
MKHLTIEYHWGNGPLPEDQQIDVEVTDDIINLVSKYDVMIREVNGKPRIYIDSKGCKFTQR